MRGTGGIVRPLPSQRHNRREERLEAPGAQPGWTTMKECLYASAGLALLIAAFPALANDPRETGTILSPREREQVVREWLCPTGAWCCCRELTAFPPSTASGTRRARHRGGAAGQRRHALGRGVDALGRPLCRARSALKPQAPTGHAEAAPRHESGRAAAYRWSRVSRRERATGRRRRTSVGQNKSGPPPRPARCFRFGRACETPPWSFSGCHAPRPLLHAASDATAFGAVSGLGLSERLSYWRQNRTSRTVRA